MESEGTTILLQKSATIADVFFVKVRNLIRFNLLLNNKFKLSVG